MRSFGTSTGTELAASGGLGHRRQPLRCTFTRRTDAGDNLLIAHFADLDLQVLRNSLERSPAADVAEMAVNGYVEATALVARRDTGLERLTALGG